MSEHITSAELQEILAGRIAPGRMKAAVAHLIRGCAVCRTVARELCFPESAPAADRRAYDVPLDRALDFAVRLERLPRGEWPRFRKALSLLAGERGVLGVASVLRIRGLGVYEAFLARSWAVRYDRPWEMLHCAKVAMEMAEGFDPRVYGRRKVADLASSSSPCGGWRSSPPCTGRPATSTSPAAPRSHGRCTRSTAATWRRRSGSTRKASP